MTNEELAVEIQRGKTEKLPELWAGVEGLVRWRAGKLCAILGEDTRIEFDELYDVGYIALIRAVRTYNPEKASFSTHFMFFIRNAFAEVTGYKSFKQRNDPLRNAMSLNTPLQDDSDRTLEETIPADVDVEKETTTKVWKQELHKELEAILSGLEGDQADVIRKHYYYNASFEEIAKAMKLHVNDVKRLNAAAMSRLRAPANLDRLRPYIERNERKSKRMCGRSTTLAQRIEQLSALRNSV